MTQRGFIKLWIGPMFAGKTSAVMRELQKYNIANKWCVCVKYSGDDRYSVDSLVTHSGDRLREIPTLRARMLQDVYDEISQYEVIAIDEIQFYPDAPRVLQSLACDGKIVLTCGLDSDYLARPFTIVAEIVAISEDVIKLKAICMRCSADASFTQRISADTGLEVIGGSDKYIAVCRSCRFK